MRASQYHLLLSQSVRAHPAILYPLALAQPIPSPPSGTGLVSEVDTANVDRPLALAQSVWAHRCGEPGLTENGQAEEAEEEEDDDVRERERERETTGYEPLVRVFQHPRLLLLLRYCPHILLNRFVPSHPVEQ